MFKRNQPADFSTDDMQPLDEPRRSWLKSLLRRRRLESMPDEPLQEATRRRRWFRGWRSRPSDEAMAETVDSLALEQRRRRRRQLALAAIPALLTSTAFGGVMVRGISGKEETRRTYQNEGRKAMTAGDFAKAKFYYSRLTGSGDLGDHRDELNWAAMLASSGDEAGALRLLNKLAPDSEVGYGPAHREKAILLMQAAAQSQTAVSPELIQLLQFHLTQGARDQSIDSHQLWAYFYLATGQSAQALSRKAQAALQNPDLWLEVAALAGPANQADRQRYLGRAEAHGKAAIAQNPLDLERRVMLVHALVQQEKYDEAEQILKTGLAVHDRPELRRLYSDLFLVRMGNQLRLADNLEASPDSLRQLVRLVGQASEIDPQNPAVYLQWAVLHSRVESENYRKQLRDHLERAIASGESIAFAHFTLGGMLWQADEHERSLFHTETAFKLDPRFMDAANNMAWMLANKEPEPELDQAEKLIRQALEQSPDKVQYLDTLGEVLVKQQRWNEALTVLERVLPQVDPASKRDLHKKLATVYHSLNQPTLAAQHEQLATE